MQNAWHESVRAVFLTPSASVLLVRVASPTGDIWITPGGRIRPGEAPLRALEREIREETGRRGTRPEAEIWIRHGTFAVDGQRVPEQERFFLVRTEEFEPNGSAMEGQELERFRGFRWWPIGDILRSKETFLPARLGELLRDLQRHGPPRGAPVETGA